MKELHRAPRLNSLPSIRDGAVAAELTLRANKAALNRIGRGEPQRTRICCLSGLAIMHRSLTSRRRGYPVSLLGRGHSQGSFRPIKVELKSVIVNAATSTRRVKTHCVSAKHGLRRQN